LRSFGRTVYSRIHSYRRVRTRIDAGASSLGKPESMLDDAGFVAAAVEARKPSS
jgi:hypothetical protein